MGSLIPFLPVPYLMPIVFMARTLDPFFLGIAAGVGGSVGKLTSYFFGRFGRRFLSEERKRKIAVLGMAIAKYEMLAVFIFALTPLPDDIVYIPVGLTGLSIAKFMIANMLGKIVLSWIVAYAGRFYFDLATLFLGEGNGLLVTIIAIVAMAAITVLLLRVDWEKVIEDGRKNGLRAALKTIFGSMFRFTGIRNKSQS
jgi:membrane protein DedA with SNARE-associated domain